MSTQCAPGRVLLVDDDADIVQSVAAALNPKRWQVATATDGSSALAAAEAFSPEVVLLDLGLPDIQGLDLIPRFHELDELTGVVVLTATNDVAAVVTAMRRGADNFLVKPVPLGTLDEVLERALGDARRKRQHRAMLIRSERGAESALLGSSRAMYKVRDLIHKVADTDATVLLQGESGTGKGLAAVEIHNQSARAAQAFLDLNCAALSPALLEAELFGYEKGAFTDASQTKLGLFEIASGGTVFLDEIGEMPLSVQSKLLKVLEDKTFRRVGGLRDLVSNVRLIAATNRDLKAQARSGDFRRDLLFRLDVFAISIPPLRSRPSDILELAHHFLGQLNRTMGAEVKGFDAAAAELLNSYSWQGNARELRNVIERAVILARRGHIHKRHLPADLQHTQRAHPSSPLRPLWEIEREHIINTIDATGGNLKRAAEILRVSRTTLYNKIRSLRISVPRQGR
jgi:two-component system response regulator AtoC